jgi:hypothetical protein
MAALIEQVGAVYQAAGSTDDGVAALLKELDVRVRRMASIVDPSAQTAPPGEPHERTPEEDAFLEAMEPGGESENPPQVEPNRVPTVSDVVWQLGRGDDEPSETAGADQPAGGRTSAVAMLEARVKELAESMPQQPPAAEVPRGSSEAGAAPEPEPAGDPPPRSPIMPEVELMWNFERMESAPYFPPTEGEAVIFGAKGEPAPAADAPSGETAAAKPGEPDLDALLFEPPPEPEAEPAAFLLEPEPSAEPPPQAPEPDGESAPSAASEAPGDPPPAATWDVEPPVPAGAPPPGARPDGPQDPLAPLMAMSDEEKIALFE